MSGHRAQTHVGMQETTNRRHDAATTLLLAAVSGIVFVPQLATNPEDFPAGLNPVWLALLLSAAPVAAFVLTRRRGPVGPAQLAVVSLSQLAITVALVRLDVWLDVRSGYLTAGSGDAAMAYGISFVLSFIVGALLAVLVNVGAGVGGRRLLVLHDRDGGRRCTGPKRTRHAVEELADPGNGRE